MGPRSTAALAGELERRTFVTVLRSHPEWRLDALFELIGKRSRVSAALRKMTVADLLAGPCDPRAQRCETDRGPAGNLRRRALRAEGVEFDELLLTTLIEAGPKLMAARDLRPLLGGPRWKLQASLGRLVAAGKVLREGKTSTTRYVAARELVQP